MHGLVGAHGAGADGLLEAVGSLDDGGHGAAVEGLRQRVPRAVGLKYKQGK